MDQARKISDEWLLRYELKQNLNLKLASGVTGTLTRTNKVTTIALPVLCTGELKIPPKKFIFISKIHFIRIYLPNIQ